MDIIQIKNVQTNEDCSDDLSRLGVKSFVKVSGRKLLQQKYKLRYKGEIIYVYLGNVDMQTIFKYKQKQKDTITNINWKDILLPFSDELSYCKESNRVYLNIDKDVSEYLDKHDCSDLIYRIASRTTTIIPLDGEIIKIYDTFIKKEKSIRLKKDTILNNTRSSHNNSFWVVRYLERIYVEETHIRLTYAQLQLLEIHAKKANVPFSELVYRYKLNISKGIVTPNNDNVCLKYALDKCIEEARKYNLVWNDDNANFIAYLKYLAKQDKIKGENK